MEEIKAHPFFTGINWSKLRYSYFNSDNENRHTFQKLKAFGTQIILTLMKKINHGFQQKMAKTKRVKRKRLSL